MSEEKGQAQSGESGGDGFKPITSQEQLDRLIGERINKVKSQFTDYDDLKSKASKLDELEEKNKTELQRIAEERDAAVKERDGLKVAQLKLDVGVSKGLTPTQAKRLVGSTKEELEADAEAFLSDLGTKAAGGVRRDPKKLQSGSKGSDDGSALTGKERAAEALRQYRTGTH